MAGRSSEPPSTRQKAHGALLEDAIARPGIREIMRVYEDWQHADHGLDPYRALADEPQHMETTDHANQR